MARCRPRAAVPPPGPTTRRARLDLDAQVAHLMRGCLGAIPEDGLRAKLLKSQAIGKPLRVKLGLDPTAPDIHLGFAVVLRKLRQFQQFGHHAIFLIGDYTALIGDPSDKNKLRPMLTTEDIQRNEATYFEQAARILDAQRTELRHNSEWLGQLSFPDIDPVPNPPVTTAGTQNDGVHRLVASQPIGAIITGFDSYVSYAYAGGTELREIVAPE